MSVSVCLSVCMPVHSHISKTAHPNFAKFSVHVIRGRGSVLLWRQCNKLRTSGFVDEVTFAHNGPGRGDAHRMCTQSDSPGGRTGSEVWHLRLACSYKWTVNVRNIRRLERQACRDSTRHAKPDCYLRHSFGGGNVFTHICLSVCLFVSSRITQVMDEFVLPGPLW